jgi:hypothetical protein
MVWGFCYLRIFKNLHSISGRSLTSNSLLQLSPDFNWTTQIVEHVITINLLQRFLSPEHLFPLGYVLPRTRTCIFKERLADFT